MPFPTKLYTYKPVVTEMGEKAIALYKDGHSLRNIGYLLDVDVRLLSDFFKRMGVPVRKSVRFPDGRWGAAA